MNGVQSQINEQKSFQWKLIEFYIFLLLPDFKIELIFLSIAQIKTRDNVDFYKIGSSWGEYATITKRRKKTEKSFPSYKLRFNEGITNGTGTSRKFIHDIVMKSIKLDYFSNEPNGTPRFNVDRRWM